MYVDGIVPDTHASELYLGRKVSLVRMQLTFSSCFMLHFEPWASRKFRVWGPALPEPETPPKPWQNSKKDQG